MTDPDMVHRAEQALLGALIQRPRQVRALDLTSAHFADPTHQAIAASLTGEAGENRGVLGRIRGFFSRFTRATREAERYMDELPGHCPDPGHFGAYYEMVSAARAEREATATQVAEQLAHGAQVISVASERLSRMNGKRDKTTDLPAEVANLARSLRGKAQQLKEDAQPQTAPGQAQQASPPPQQNQEAGQPQPAAPESGPPASQPADGTVSGRNAPSAPAPAPPVDTVPYQQPHAPLQREDLENNILVCLMTNPHEARRVTAWLPAEVFDEGPRRELYSLISDFVANRTAIDPVTLAWAAQQRHEAGQSEGWLSPDFVLGLGELRVAPGTAEVLGAPLLADHIYRSTIDEHWAQSGQFRLGTRSEQQPLRPEPGAAQTAELETTEKPAAEQQPPAQKTEQGPRRHESRHENNTQPEHDRPPLVESPPNGPAVSGQVQRM